MLTARGACRGGFIKRDGRPREIETLISRLVDRPLRPLFHKGWRRDTQILQWVLSYDPDSCPHPHAITAAAASLLVSDIPFPRAVAGVRVVMCNDKFVINPTVQEQEGATLDLLVAGTEAAVLMIEGSAKFIPEATVLDAIDAAHKAIGEICSQLQVRPRTHGGLLYPLCNLTFRTMGPVYVVVGGRSTWGLHGVCG